MANKNLETMIAKINVTGSDFGQTAGNGSNLAMGPAANNLSVTKHASWACPDSDTERGKRYETEYVAVSSAIPGGRSGSFPGVFRSDAFTRKAKPAILFGWPRLLAGDLCQRMEGSLGTMPSPKRVLAKMLSPICAQPLFPNLHEVICNSGLQGSGQGEKQWGQQWVLSRKRQGATEEV